MTESEKKTSEKKEKEENKSKITCFAYFRNSRNLNLNFSYLDKFQKN